MPRYVAFLRAINVGGHTVRMADLRAGFEALGFAGVETFIASGNVIFDAPAADAAALEGEIERHLRAALGYDVLTFVRTTAEVAHAATHDAFAAPPNGEALMVAFLKAAPDAGALGRLAAVPSDLDTFAADGREVYWRISGGRVSDSRFSGPLFERTVGAPATVRSVTTVRKLAAKYPPGAGTAE